MINTDTQKKNKRVEREVRENGERGERDYVQRKAEREGKKERIHKEEER